jgi:Arc/MetJ-type ribon-helix-helix transcriptional regulator
METVSLNISLPRVLREYVEQRVEEEAYSTPSEYVRALIREDQKRRDRQKLKGAPVGRVRELAKVNGKRSKRSA